MRNAIRFAAASCALACVFVPVARGAPPPLEAFAQMPAVRNYWSSAGTNRSMAISPDGRYLSWVAPSKQKQMAVVLDLTTGKAKGVLSSEGNELDLRWCSWANPQRLICSLG